MSLKPRSSKRRTQARTVAADRDDHDTVLQVSPTIPWWFCHIEIPRTKDSFLKRHQNRRSSASFAARYHHGSGLQPQFWLVAQTWRSQNSYSNSLSGSNQLPLLTQSVSTNLPIFGDDFWGSLDVCHTSIELTVVSSLVAAPSSHHWFKRP